MFLDPHILHTVNRPDVVMSRGDGVYLFDEAGKRYLDAIGGWAVTCLGHGHPILNEALFKQSEILWNASAYFLNRPMLDFSQFLCKKSGLDRVFFGSSGAEVNECAIKLARKYGALHKKGAYEIVTLTNSFHGRTLACMSATGKEAFKELFEPKVPGFFHVPINDLDAIKAAIKPNVVAIMVEPIQGEGGVNICSEDYLKAVRELCDQHDILLIFDEVQTGIGRTGKFFDFEHAGIKPDILTLGKGLGGGYPISAMLCSESLNIFDAGEQGGTYSGQALGMAVGLAVAKEVSKPAFLAHVKKTGTYIFDELCHLSKTKPIASVRGRGLLVAFDVDGDAPLLAKRLLDLGVIVNASSNKTIRLIPPLVFTKSHVDELLSCLKKAL